MTIAWIARNAAGIVRAFSDVCYTNEQTLNELAEGEQNVDLIEAERITLNKPIPADARILKTWRTR